MCQRTEEGVGSPGPEITGSREPPDNGAGEPNSGPVQEQQAFLTVKSSLLPWDEFLTLE